MIESKIRDEIQKHEKLHSYDESTRNLKCKFDGSINEAQDIIVKINRS